jgi:hypothetical protein
MLRNRTVVWLLAAAILCNALAFVITPSKPTQIVDGVLGVITICSSSGDSGSDEPPAQGKHCPQCTLTSVFTLATLDARVAVPAGLPAWRPLRAGAETLRARRVGAGALGSRAPPQAAV